MYQNQQPIPQTVTHKRGANHWLHLVLSILTCGVWAITGWPIAAAIGRKHTTTVLPHAPYPQQDPRNEAHQHTTSHQPPNR